MVDRYPTLEGKFLAEVALSVRFYLDFHRRIYSYTGSHIRLHVLHARRLCRLRSMGECDRGFGMVMEEHEKVFSQGRRLPDITGTHLIRSAQNERLVPSADGHDTRTQYDPSVHSTTGMTTVSLPNYPQVTLDNRTIKASKQLGGDFKFNLDDNDGSVLGLSGYPFHCIPLA